MNDNTSDFRFASSKNEESILKTQLLTIKRKFNIPILEILSVDVYNRLTSFKMTCNRYGRFYHRYWIFVIYKYDKSIDLVDFSLLDITFYRFFSEDKIYQIFCYEVYYRSLLLIYLPSFFNAIKKKYRVIFVNSYPPFDDEAHSIIEQEKNLNDNYRLIPLLPYQGYIVIEVESVIYICKIDKRSRLFSGHTNRKDDTGMHITSWVSPCSTLLAMEKSSFLRQEVDWMPLDVILTGNRYKSRSILFNQKEKNLNPFGKCENIFDEGFTFFEE